MKRLIVFAGIVLLGLASVAAAQPAAEPVSSAVPEVAAEPAAGSTAEPKPLNLVDCYALSLKQSETIAINKDLIGEAEARFVQSLGTMLPHVSVTSSDTIQDETSSGSSASSDALFNRPHTFERRLVVKQLLFSGFKELAGLAGTRHERSQRTNEWMRAQQLLWGDVANAFYLLLEQRRDIRELEETRTALKDRITELQERVKVGRSRQSEVVNTEAQLYTLEAQIEDAKSQVRVAQDLLEFLMGKVLTGELDEGTTDLPTLLSKEDYLANTEVRHDVLALKDAFAVSQSQVQVASSGLYPTISMEGDYFLERNTSPENSSWGALLSIDVPLFQGTEVYGQIAQARLQAHESELAWQRGKRISNSAAMDAYHRASAEIVKCNALRQAMESAEENYRLQREDYQMNLVSNLDVLAAIQTRNDARRNYYRSFFEAKRLYENLLVTSGTVDLSANPAP